MDLTSAISNLGNDYVSKITQAMTASTDTSSKKAGNVDSFDSIYNAVSSMVNSTNSYIQQAEQAEIDFALGKMTNTHELGVYQQQANVALQFTVAVRDKALEAYKEIMNMSI